MKTITFEFNSDDENDKNSLKKSDFNLNDVRELQKKLSELHQASAEGLSKVVYYNKISLDYAMNLESVNSFLNIRGLISPNKKIEFLNWFFDKVTKANSISEPLYFLGYPNLERKDIIEFAQLLTMEAESELIKTKRKLNREKTINKNKGQIPTNFQGIFLKPEMADNYLKVLNDIQPPIIDINYNYIGNNKGFFPLWIDILKRKSPKIIEHFPDIVYKNLLNQKVKGLNLSKDASEFKKHYKRAEKKRWEIGVLISQVSLEGK